MLVVAWTEKMPLAPIRRVMACRRYARDDAVRFQQRSFVF